LSNIVTSLASVNNVPEGDIDNYNSNTFFVNGGIRSNMDGYPDRFDR